MTSFKPDHTSLTAQTLMSTKPSGNASSLIVSSVMSVSTLDTFFGQETHTNPVCSSFFLNATRWRFSFARFVTKRCTALRGLLELEAM